ncbi:MAG: flavin-containing monooxygenase [Jiangellaceae bacterium]
MIGAGQAGLAVGYHLAQRGRRFVILETNDRIGASWRNRWSSLRLFTPARYSGLPGWAFPGARWSYPTKDEVADYLEAYAARFELQVRAGVRVDCLLREADRYILTMGPRRLEADQVVVASGAYHSPFVPDFPSELDPSIVQLHSRECRDPSQLRDGGVLVVGAGNSGAEIAADVSSTHRTWISGRDTGHLPFHPGTVWDRLFTPLIWFMGSRVLTLNTPIGRKVRPKALSMGHPLEQVQPHDLAAAGVQRVPRTAGVRDGFPVLDDGRVLHVSNVIWCTGFRPDFGWINRPAFDETGEPVHDRGVVRSEPGLYFVGRFFQHSLTSSLIGGVGEDAAYIARHLATQPTRVERPSSAGRRSSGGFAESHDV